MRFQVPDHTGHSNIDFDIADPKMLEAAKAKFDELVKGYKVVEETGETVSVPPRWAAKKFSDGRQELARTFDPTASEISFHNHLQGG